MIEFIYLKNKWDSLGSVEFKSFRSWWCKKSNRRNKRSFVALFSVLVVSQWNISESTIWEEKYLRRQIFYFHRNQPTASVEQNLCDVIGLIHHSALSIHFYNLIRGSTNPNFKVLLRKEYSATSRGGKLLLPIVLDTSIPGKGIYKIFRVQKIVRNLRKFLKYVSDGLVLPKTLFYETFNLLACFFLLGVLF